MSLQIKRIYQPVSSDEGYRILVDRIWPRGISKQKADIDEWIKEIAPSTELRKWFNHIPDRFDIFRNKYEQELISQTATLLRIKKLAQKQKVTLLYGAKDKTHNQAVVLMSIIQLLTPTKG